MANIIPKIDCGEIKKKTPNAVAALPTILYVIGFAFSVRQYKNAEYAITAVSYTHLDVYKRQQQFFSVF